MLYNTIEKTPQSLPDLYRLAQKQVYKGLKDQKAVIKLSDSDRNILSQSIPQCISYILKELPKKSDKINFNSLVMILVTYFQMAAWVKEDSWAKVQGFVLDYPHSETYYAPQKRSKHWDSQWNYLQGQHKYKFDCSYIKGLGLPGKAFNCNKCIGKKKTPASFSSVEVLEALNQNEDGDARLFVELFKGILCFDHTERRWYTRKKDGHWEEDMLDQATAFLKKVVSIYTLEVKRQSNNRIRAEKKGHTEEADKIEKNIKELYKRIRLLQSKPRKVNVLQLASSGEHSLGITGLEWDKDPWLLGCKNGIVDLRIGDLKPVHPEAFIKTVAPTEWKGIDTPCPTWNKFLRDIFNNDIVLIDFIQRLFGLSMVGEVTEDIFPIFWGEEGRNGKDTLFETLKFVLGSSASPIESELLLAQRFNKRAGMASPEVLALRGKRIVWASETEEGRKFDVAKIKFYTGGGTLVARGLYARRPVTFPPSFTIFLITNPKPKAKGDDPAFWERVVLIPLTQRFVKNPNGPNEHKADIYMPKKLQKEASGILAWLIRGCLQWRQYGLNPPSIVLQATREYKLEEDDLSRFIHDCCDRRSNANVQAGKLYEAYEQWTKENTDETITNQAFYKKMLKKVNDSYRTNKGKFYVGIELKKSTGSTYH